MAYVAPYMDSAGIHIPTYQEILEDNIQTARRIYGQDLYLGNDSQDYQLLSALSVKLYDTLQAVVLAYNNRSPLTAIGSGLDALVKINGLKRLAATPSTAQVTLTGVAETVIQGGLVADRNQVQWALPQTVTLNGEGKATVEATATVTGPVQAAAGTITTIVTPQNGWWSVTNPEPAIPGRDVETDEELRARQAISTANPSQAPIEGIRGGVASVPGVLQSKVYENDTDQVDENGLPPHSITAVVEGGDEEEIARQIFLRKTPGGYTNGTTAVEIVDRKGAVNTIRFSRPEPVDIWITLQIKTLPGYVNSLGIVDALVAFVEGLGIGDSVYLSSLIGAALSSMQSLAAPSFTVVSLTAGTSAQGLGSQDIPLAYNQLARTDGGKIAVTVS